MNTTCGPGTETHADLFKLVHYRQHYPSALTWDPLGPGSLPYSHGDPLLLTPLAPVLSTDLIKLVYLAPVPLDLFKLVHLGSPWSVHTCSLCSPYTWWQGTVGLPLKDLLVTSYVFTTVCHSVHRGCLGPGLGGCLPRGCPGMHSCW